MSTIKVPLNPNIERCDMKKMYKIILISSLIIITFSGLAFGQASPERNDAIQNDLDILNNILNKLIISDSPFVFSFDDRVNGVYLDGFGMLFDMESYGLYDVAESVKRAIEKIEIVDTKGDTVIKIRSSQKDKSDKEKSADSESKSITEKVTETKNLLMQFYRDYASAVKSLKPEERVVVNIRIRNRQSGYPFAEEKVPSQLRASIKADDLIKFRQGKLPEDQFLKKIQFAESFDSQTDNEIEIMENILNTALGKSKSRRPLAYSGGTRGIYLDNFGILFFSPSSIFDKGMKVLVNNLSHFEEKAREFERKTREFERQNREYELKIKEYQKAEDKALSEPPEAPEAPEAPEMPAVDIDIDWNGSKMFGQSKAAVDSMINVMSDQVIELLGRYGHTMRKVKDNEWVMVAIDFNYKIWDTEDSRLYLKVRKSDLLKYNRDEIDLNGLKKLIKTWRG